ncbi:MAG: hypothetical protein AAGI07_09915 [Bacteroidota bacterium]
MDDKRRGFTLYGKPSYGNARGIWQTIYLEARGQDYLDQIHFTSDIDSSTVKIKVYLPGYAEKDLSFNITITTENEPILKDTIISKDQANFEWVAPIPNPKL